MELLVTGLSQGRHVYKPFSKEDAPSELRRNPLSLKKLCQRAIIALSTLRGLKGADIPELPPILRRRLMTVKTKNLVEVECAPFMDIFGCFIYHRSLAYRVRCSLDGAEYLATHGGTCSLMQLGEDFRQWQWVELMHPNIMSIYAVTLDNLTSDLFFIMDVPETTLEGLEVVLFSHGLCFPEHFLWKVAQQLSSAIMYVEERQLSFGQIKHENVYVIQKRILLENKLTWKSSMDTSPHQNRVQSVMLGDTVISGGRYELWTNSLSKVSVKSLGIVLERLAGIGLVHRTQQSPPPSLSLETAVGTSAVPPNVLNYLPVFDGFKPRVPEGDLTYSSDLMDLLESFHASKLPPLADVYAKAVEMMTSIEANRRIYRHSDGEKCSDALRSEARQD